MGINTGVGLARQDYMENLNLSGHPIGCISFAAQAVRAQGGESGRWRHGTFQHYADVSIVCRRVIRPRHYGPWSSVLHFLYYHLSNLYGKRQQCSPQGKEEAEEGGEIDELMRPPYWGGRRLCIHRVLHSRHVAQVDFCSRIAGKVSFVFCPSAHHRYSGSCVDCATFYRFWQLDAADV